MHYVAQAGDDDCGVAVLAMLTDRTLAEAVEWIGWDGKPLKPHQMHWWLWKDGWYLRSIKLAADLPTSEWPPPPFADAHYAMVTATKGGHWTVMDGTGRLLDPWDVSRESLSVYSAVHEIVGLQR
jgi:hypothetical protein